MKKPIGMQFGRVAFGGRIEKKPTQRARQRLAKPLGEGLGFVRGVGAQVQRPADGVVAALEGADPAPDGVAKSVFESRPGLRGGLAPAEMEQGGSQGAPLAQAKDGARAFLANDESHGVGWASHELARVEPKASMGFAMADDDDRLGIFGARQADVADRVRVGKDALESADVESAVDPRGDGSLVEGVEGEVLHGSAVARHGIHRARSRGHPLALRSRKQWVGASSQAGAEASKRRQGDAGHGGRKSARVGGDFRPHGGCGGTKTQKF